jgi:hypothetical protein
MVIYIHQVFIGVKDRLRQAGNLNIIIRHPLDPDCGAIGQNRRTIPDFKDENAAGVQVLPCGLKRC